MSRLKLLAVASPLDPGLEASLRGAAFSLLSSAESRGVEVEFLGLKRRLDEEPSAGEGDLALAVMTGGTEAMVLRVARAWDGGVALLATPVANSLAASLEAAAALRAEGRLVRVVKSESWSDVRWDAVLSSIRASRAVQTLTRARFALVGPPSDWLVASPATLGLLAERGARLDEVPMDDLMGALKEAQADPREVEEVLSGARDSAVRGEDVERALRVKVALQRLIRSRGYLGVTVRCFDLIPAGMTACLAAALLNDAHTIVGCEGDVPAMVSMALLAALSGSPAWMANTTDVGRDFVLLSHCTFPLGLARGYSLKTHFESGISVGVDAELPEGEKVTLARVDPAGRRATVGSGVVRESSMGREGMCRTQVLVELPRADRLLSLPVGNHFALTRGDLADEASEVLEFLGFSVSRL